MKPKKKRKNKKKIKERGRGDTRTNPNVSNLPLLPKQRNKTRNKQPATSNNKKKERINERKKEKEGKAQKTLFEISCCLALPSQSLSLSLPPLDPLKNPLFFAEKNGFRRTLASPEGSLVAFGHGAGKEKAENGREREREKGKETEVWGEA